MLEDVGYSTEGIEMDALIHQQSADIAGVVSNSKEKQSEVSANQEEFSSGAGDQGSVIGYVSRCQVFLDYAIEVAQPVMVQVDTFETGTVCG